MMVRMVGGWVFLLVPAHPGSPGQRAIKRLLLLWVAMDEHDLIRLTKSDWTFAIGQNLDLIGSHIIPFWQVHHSVHNSLSDNYQVSMCQWGGHMAPLMLLAWSNHCLTIDHWLGPVTIGCSFSVLLWCYVSRNYNWETSINTFADNSLVVAAAAAAFIGRPLHLDGQ